MKIRLTTLAVAIAMTACGPTQTQAEKDAIVQEVASLAAKNKADAEEQKVKEDEDAAQSERIRVLREERQQREKTAPWYTKDEGKCVPGTPVRLMDGLKSKGYTQISSNDPLAKYGLIQEFTVTDVKLTDSVPVEILVQWGINRAVFEMRFFRGEEVCVNYYQGIADTAAAESKVLQNRYK